MKVLHSGTTEAVPELVGTPSPGAARRPLPHGGEGRGSFHSSADVAKRHHQLTHSQSYAYFRN
jgi:hypothetical protein